GDRRDALLQLMAQIRDTEGKIEGFRQADPVARAGERSVPPIDDGTEPSGPLSPPHWWRRSATSILRLGAAFLNLDRPGSETTFDGWRGAARWDRQTSDTSLRKLPIHGACAVVSGSQPPGAGCVNRCAAGPPPLQHRFCCSGE